MKILPRHETAILSGLFIIAGAVSFLLVGPIHDGVEKTPAMKQARVLTALDHASPQAKVRALIASGARPSRIWEALEHCKSSDDLAKLFEATLTPVSGAMWLNRYLVMARWCEIDPAAAAEASVRQWIAVGAATKAIRLWAELDPQSA